jgi:hypothetical protein
MKTTQKFKLHRDEDVWRLPRVGHIVPAARMGVSRFGKRSDGCFSRGSSPVNVTIFDCCETKAKTCD